MQTVNGGDSNNAFVPLFDMSGSSVGVNCLRLLIHHSLFGSDQACGPDRNADQT